MDALKRKKRGVLLPLAIMLLGIAARVLLFGDVPGGLNQDETFAGYEAWCLLNFGRDSAGYAYPVYLTAWGSGMNALESYMMIPFIALFGLEEWVIRLPQLIMALVSLWVCYLTVRRLRDEGTALAAMGLLAICPWHIMLSRWGLESNLTPAFLLLGFFFFIKAAEDSRFLLLSALMYGLSLYCYATIWPILPFLLLGQGLYCLRNKLLKADRYMLLSVCLLFVMALPLLLFLAVNFGLMEEIRTYFFSIPRLLYMRSGELSPKKLPENFLSLCKLLLTQNDGLAWNGCGAYGLIYYISLPFALLGIADCIKRCRKEKGGYAPLLLMQLAAGLILGVLVKANVNRVNIIFIPLVILTACGIKLFCSFFGRKMQLALLLLYAMFFVGFGLEYFGDYRYTIGYYFDDGLEQALIAAEAEAEGTIYLPEDLHYPKLLFYTEMPPEEFESSVEYVRYPAAYLDAKRIGNYVFGCDMSAPEEDSVYIIKRGNDTAAFAGAGFSLDRYGNFVVAYIP